MNRSMPSPGGSPHRANLRRLEERALRRTAVLVVDTPGGRRRKKAILTAELPRYRDLIRSVALELAARRAARGTVTGQDRSVTARTGDHAA